MMKIRYFFSIMIFSCTSVLAETRQCTKDDAQDAQRVVGVARSWEQSYQQFGRYGHCDNGTVAEGFSQSQTRLLAERWADLGQLGEIVEAAPAFRDFVIQHINDSIPAERAKRIAENARRQCPPSSYALCRAIERAALHSHDIWRGEVKHAHMPSNGLVPDEATAVAIAEAVLVPIYGKRSIENQQPFSVSLDNDVWTVSGQQKQMPNRVLLGGVFRITISRQDASVRMLTHGK